jgi:hypothetical protein
LPRDLRSRVQAAGTQFQSERAHFEANRATVEQAIAAEPDLFRARAAAWRESLGKAQAQLGEADAAMTSLRRLSDANRREDREKVEQELASLASLRSGAVSESEEIRRDAERWLGYKRELPRQLEVMKSAYESVRAWDPATAMALAQKAMVDWPAKKDDLQHRIDALVEFRKQGETAWQSTSEMRTKAEAQDWADIDYAALFAGNEQLHTSLKQLLDGASVTNTLAQQLYVDRNKLLIDLEDGPRQKVRVVETKFSDSSLSDGQTTQQERWENIDEARFHNFRDNIGMVIERKPAGKYDSEAEGTPQAPAYAYVAAPGQSNQYGSWSNGVWQWLPQYLILSQLLRSTHPPITTGDYFDYERARRRGELWYGRSGEYRRPWGDSSRWSRRGSTLRRTIDSIARSSGGGWYRERSRSEQPRALGSGGYSGSKYQTRGTYSGSRYQSRPGGYSKFGSRSYSRGFGRGGRR